MDDLDLQPSEFVTDNDDLDSLDDQIELEQRRCNTQLWSSFQNAACCIAQLYKGRYNVEKNSFVEICAMILYLYYNNYMINNDFLF